MLTSMGSMGTEIQDPAARNRVPSATGSSWLRGVTEARSGVARVAGSTVVWAMMLVWSSALLKGLCAIVPIARLGNKRLKGRADGQQWKRPGRWVRAVSQTEWILRPD